MGAGSASAGVPLQEPGSLTSAAPMPTFWARKPHGWSHSVENLAWFFGWGELAGLAWMYMELGGCWVSSLLGHLGPWGAGNQEGFSHRHPT